MWSAAWRNWSKKSLHSAAKARCVNRIWQRVTISTQRPATKTSMTATLDSSTLATWRDSLSNVAFMPVMLSWLQSLEEWTWMLMLSSASASSWMASSLRKISLKVVSLNLRNRAKNRAVQVPLPLTSVNKEIRLEKWDQWQQQLLARKARDIILTVWHRLSIKWHHQHHYMREISWPETRATRTSTVRWMADQVNSSKARPRWQTVAKTMPLAQPKSRIVTKSMSESALDLKRQDQDRH